MQQAVATAAATGCVLSLLLSVFLYVRRHATDRGCCATAVLRAVMGVGGFLGVLLGWFWCWGVVVFLRVPQVGYVSQPDGPRRLLSFVYMDRQGPMPLLPAVVHLENPRATYVLTSGHMIRFIGARVTTLATAAVFFFSA